MHGLLGCCLERRKPAWVSITPSDANMSVGASGQEMGFIERKRCAPPRLRNRRQREHLANHYHQRWTFEGSRPSSFPHFDSRSSCCSRGNPWWRRYPDQISPYSRSARHDCLYSRAERRKQTTCLASREPDQGGCLPLLPSFGSSEPSYFGSGFCKGLDEESIEQGSSLGFECIDDGSSPPADRPPEVSRAYAGSRAFKRCEVEEFSCLTPSREHIPTLVEMHKAVIDSALQEFFRLREGPFENLGERLGGGRESFTYCDRSIRMPRGSHNVAFGEIEQCPLLHQMDKTSRWDDATISETSSCEGIADRNRRLFRCTYMGTSKSWKPRGLLSGPQQKKRSQVTDGCCSGAKQTECDVDEFESREEFSQGESHQAEEHQQPTLPQAGTCHTTLSAVHCTTSRKVPKRCDASELELSSNKPRRLRTAVRYSETASHSRPLVDSPLRNERLQPPPCTYMRSQIIHTASTAVRRTKKQSSGRADTEAPTQHKPRASIVSRKGPNSTTPRRHGGDNHARRLVGKRAMDPRSTRDSHPPSLKRPIDLDRNNNGAVVSGEAANGEESSSEPKSDTKKTVGVGEGVREEDDQDAAAIVLTTERTLEATSRAIVEDCVGRVLSCSASWSPPMMKFRPSMTKDCTAACSAGREVAASSPMTTSGSSFIGGSTVRVLEMSNPSSVVDGESLPAYEERTVSSSVSSGLSLVAEEPFGSGASLALSATKVTAASKGPMATPLSAALLPVHFESKNDVACHTATRVIEESIQRAIAPTVKE